MFSGFEAPASWIVLVVKGWTNPRYIQVLDMGPLRTFWLHQQNIKGFKLVIWMSWKNQGLKAWIFGLPWWFPAGYLFKTIMVTSLRHCWKLNAHTDVPKPNISQNAAGKHPWYPGKEVKQSKFSSQLLVQDASLASPKGSKTVQSLRSSWFLSPFLAGNLTVNPRALIC